MVLSRPLHNQRQKHEPGGGASATKGGSETRPYEFNYKINDTRLAIATLRSDGVGPKGESSRGAIQLRETATAPRLPASLRMASALSVRSQVKPGPLRPKWP